MIALGYAIMGAALVIALAALFRNRDRLIVLALFYFVSYEAMSLSLQVLGHYRIIPYMCLAVAIDTFFFYKFLDKKATMSYLAVAASAFYGGLTVIQCTAGVYALYSVYEYVNIAISLLILIDGGQRAYNLKHTPTDGGHGVLSWLINRLVANRKG